MQNGAQNSEHAWALIDTLSVSSLITLALIFDLAGVALGGVAVYALSRNQPFARRLGYALSSAAVGAGFSVFAADLVLAMNPSWPVSVRMPIGVLCVVLSLPLMSFLRGIVRVLADNPQGVIDYLKSLAPGGRAGDR